MEASVPTRQPAKSGGSINSKRRKSTKVIKYSAQAVAQFILLSTGAFLSLALLGLSVQGYRYLKGDTPTIVLKSSLPSPPTTNDQGESLASLAIATTATAIRLWGKVLVSILIPTTNTSLVYAKEGWSALEPSLRQSILWFIYETTIQFKVAVFMGCVLLFLIWLLEREIKKRRIIERISARVKVVTDRVNAVVTTTKEKYQAVKKEIERESRIAAQLLPHFLYICTCIAIFWFFPDIYYHASRGFGAWSVIVGIPIIMSSRQMLKYDELRRSHLKRANPLNELLSSSSDSEEEEAVVEDPEDEEDERTSNGSKKASTKQKAEVYVESMVEYLRKRLLSDASLSSTTNENYAINTDTVRDLDPLLDWLRYWSVLSVCIFLEQFPLTGHFLSVLPVWPEIRLSFALWLQLPITRGCDWAFSAVVPLLDRYVKKIPIVIDSTTAHQVVEQRSVVITLLSSLGIVSKKTGKKLMKATETNSTLIMLSIPFMLSPSFVTKIGILVVGLAFPAHSSTTSVLEIEHFKISSKKNDDEAEKTESGEMCVFWLEYWIVYVIFSLLHAPLGNIFGWWFPLWDQLHLAVLLWLQISYFSGAHNVFKIAVVIARVYRRRQRAAARNRRRRRTESIPTPQEKIEDFVSSMIPFVDSIRASPIPEEIIDDDEHTDEEHVNFPIHQEQGENLKIETNIEEEVVNSETIEDNGFVQVENDE